MIRRRVLREAIALLLPYNGGHVALDAFGPDPSWMGTTDADGELLCRLCDELAQFNQKR